MEATATLEERWEGMSCTVVVRRPAPGVILVVIEGRDAGELGVRPFRALVGDLARHGRVDLFIDARATRGASVDVTSWWAAWLARHKASLRSVSFLARSRYVQLTADVLRRFSALGDLMRVYADADAFDAAVAQSIVRNGPVTLGRPLPAA